MFSDICNDYAVVRFLTIIKSSLDIIRIIGPILSMVALVFFFIRLMGNPEDKKVKKGLTNSIIALIVLFLIPTIINVTIGLVVGDFSLQNCLEQAERKNNQVDYSQFADGYISSGKEPSTIITDPDDYDEGSTSDVVVTGNFVDVANDVWLKVVNGNFSYRAIYNNKTYYNQIPIINNYIDCSGFVSWVLYEYGYKEQFGGKQKKTIDFMETDWTKYGWQVIDVAAGEDVSDKIQEGDILVRADRSGSGYSFGHVNIIAKVRGSKIYAYDCGSESFWRNSSGEPIDASWFVKDSRPGKIIRVS